MRLIYPVVALMGVLALSGCSHDSGANHNHAPGFSAKNYGLTYEQVREAAQDGDADAQYALGYMYYYGQNVTRNGKQARFWIAKSAAQNHQQAIKALRMMGSPSEYVSGDSASSQAVAQVSSPDHSVAAAQNTWQAVRRPQAQTNFGQVSQSQSEGKVSGVNSVATHAAQTSSPQSNNAFQANSGKSDAQGSDQVASTQSSDTDPAKAQAGSIASNSESSVSRKKHPRTALRKKNHLSHQSSQANNSLTSDERSILSAPSDHYTLQLIGTSSKATLQKMIGANGLQHKAKVYHTTVKGKDFYGLVYGNYRSQAEARAAIARLPANLQQLKPWAKPYATVKASIKAG